MGHTNSTANLSLPQFIGTDKPTWLGDVNGAFSAIDSYAGTNDAAVAAAVSDASSAISQAAAAVNTANTANTTAGNASTAANNAIGVANTANAIAGTVDAKVGLLADLNTTDRTNIVNAINEVNGKDAGDIAYDNSGSGLTATNVQDAIDEVAQGGGGTESIEVIADGVKTNSQVLDALFAQIDMTKVSFKTTLTTLVSGSTSVFDLTEFSSSVLEFSRTRIDGSNIKGNSVYVKTSGSDYFSWYGDTSPSISMTNYSSTVAASGSVFKITY